MKQILFFCALFINTVVHSQETSYFCELGSSKTLTASCSGGTAPYTYTWKSPAGVVTSGATKVINNVSQEGIWIWECTDAIGCTNMGSHEIIYEPNPEVDITIVAVNTCNNTSQIVSATGVPSGYIYSWNFGSGATPATSTTPTTSVLWSTAGSKTITLTISKAFDGTACDVTCVWGKTKVVTIGSGSLTGLSSCSIP